jgi:hypothetical protein
MLQTEVTQRRAAALADLTQWFDMEPADLRTANADGQLVVIARLPGSKARKTATRLLGQHFPSAPVRFEP